MPWCQPMSMKAPRADPAVVVVVEAVVVVISTVLVVAVVLVVVEGQAGQQLPEPLGVPPNAVHFAALRRIRQTGACAS